jgi:hypothetical protein
LTCRVFIRFYRALDAIVHGDDESPRVAHESQRGTGGTPLAVIQSLSGLVHAIAYLDARRARLSDGAVRRSLARRWHNTGTTMKLVDTLDERVRLNRLVAATKPLAG